MRIALVLVLASCASSMAMTKFEPTDRTAIQKVLDDQIAAWNRGDLAAYMEGYAKIDGLVFTSSGNVRKGWQDAFDHYQARYATDKASMGKLRFEILAMDPIGADGVVVLGNWILTGSPHDGRGVFSLVLARRPEGWRIVHDHTSLAAPPPATSPPATPPAT